MGGASCSRNRGGLEHIFKKYYLISIHGREGKPFGPAVGPGGLKVVDQVAREESFLGKVSRLANTSKRVAGADGG